MRSPCVLMAVGVMAGINVAPSAPADVIYNEIVDGDLSDNRLAPTALLLAPGENQFFGIMEGGVPTLDLDYFSITIPAGFELREVTLDLYASKDFAAFLAIQPGSVFPNDPDGVTPGDLMGWIHFGRDQEFQDILSLMGQNGQGFTPPLPAGTYSFWGQQIDDYTDYALTFVVAEVPAPAGVMLGAAAGGAACMRRRRRT